MRPPFCFRPLTVCLHKFSEFLAGAIRKLKNGIAIDDSLDSGRSERNSRRARFEPLECRSMLTGVWLTTETSIDARGPIEITTVLIEGDDSANDIRVIERGSGEEASLFVSLDGDTRKFKMTDLIPAATGQDKIRRGANVHIKGMNGNDNVFCKTEALTNHIWGDDGDDRVFVRGNARVFGGDGDDRITVDRPASIQGGDGNDVIRTKGGPVDGEGGNDRIFLMGPGTANGGSGRDVIRVVPSDETFDTSLQGGSHSDRIFGGPGMDAIDGGAGNDVLRGGSGGRDEFFGGAGNDRMFGSPTGENNFIYGHGKQGHDRIRALGGDNRIELFLSGPAQLNLENNPDTRTQVVNHDYLTLTFLSNPEGFKDVIGSDHDDIIVGHKGANRIYGGKGNDNIYGAGGKGEVIVGGPGNDGLFTDGVDSKVYGGSGADRILNLVNKDGTFRSKVKDLATEDAVVYFVDGRNDNAFEMVGKSWSFNEILAVDRGLEMLHKEINSTDFLKSHDGKSIWFSRFKYHGRDVDGRNFGNDSDGKGSTFVSIAMFDSAFRNLKSTTVTTRDYYAKNTDVRVRNTAIHEIGHNWDQYDSAQPENSYVPKFRKVSDWAKTQKTTSHVKNTKPKEVWWYSGSSSFLDEEAKKTPREDFAWTWEYYFSNYAKAAKVVPKKLDIVESFIKSYHKS